MENKKLYSVQDVAERLGVTLDDVIDLIQCGDLPAVGSNKQFVKLCELNEFLGMETADTRKEESSIDFYGKQRSNASHSILIEDISESEWMNMEKKGSKEHRPYFDKQKQRWCIALSLGKNSDGKRIRKIISGVTQADVWDAYREFISQQKEIAPVAQDAPIVTDGLADQLGIVTYSPKQDVLFSECYAKFLKGLESTIVNRTYGDYVTTSRYIVEKLGHLKMYELNRDVIANFLTDLRNAKYAKPNEKTPTHFYSQSRLNTSFDLLHRFIKEYSDGATREPLLARDFMAGMDKPRTRKISKDDTVPCNAEEIQRILDAVESDKMVSCWVHIMAETGCRPSEALGLMWGDIDFKNKTISFTKALGKEAEYDPVTNKRITPYWGVIKNIKNDDGKNHKVDFQRRTLRISENTLQAVRKWHDEFMRDKKRANAVTAMFMFVTLNRNGKYHIYDDYAKKYGRILNKVGLSSSEFNPYRFRHTVCTHLLKKGIDLKTVQMIMGDNTSDMILKVYANISKEDMLASSVALSSRMADIIEKPPVAK